jgi:hypothetical protein
MCLATGDLNAPDRHKVDPCAAIKMLSSPSSSVLVSDTARGVSNDLQQLRVAVGDNGTRIGATSEREMMCPETRKT